MRNSKQQQDKTAHPSLQFPKRKPWLRQASEPEKYYAEFVDYLSQGPTRSILSVANLHNKNKTQYGGTPTSWTEKSKKYQWVDRASEYDRWIAAKSLEEYEAHRAKIRRTGFALTEARVDSINTEIERIDVLVEDALKKHLFSDYQKLVQLKLKCLEELAKELGERQPKKEQSDDTNTSVVYWPQSESDI